MKGEALTVRLLRRVSPRKARSGILSIRQSRSCNSSSQTRLRKPSGSNSLRLWPSLHLTVRPTVSSLGITPKLVRSAWLLMAERVHSRAIRLSSPPSRNGCEEQSWGTATPAPIVFCIHSSKSHHGFMAAAAVSGILDEARILVT